MVRISKCTKIIKKTESEIEILQKKVDIERKRMELGEISKADFVKYKSKMDTKERNLRSRIHRYQKIRVMKEREEKEKEEERKKRRAEREEKRKAKKGK